MSPAEDPRPDVLVHRPATGVAVVTLNRPERLNALRFSTIPSLAGTFRRLAADDSVQVVVLTGAGRGFCTGMDLSSSDEWPPPELEASTAWMRRLFDASVALSELPQPTIAAVNGPATGGGFGLALACDLRVASLTASFSASFVRLGLTPDAGLSRTLPAVVGMARALELTLSARTVYSTEALRLGLVSDVSHDALARALALADEFARVPAHTSRAIKHTLATAAASDLGTTLDRIEPRAQAAMFCHPDFSAIAGATLSRHA